MAKGVIGKQVLYLYLAGREFSELLFIGTAWEMQQMNRRKFVGLWLVTVVLGSSPLMANEDPVEVPDENLQAVILEIKAKKQSEGEEITLEDLKNIYFLQANGRGIEDLAGLEHCSNLREVKLANNNIQNVAPLAKCSLVQSLDLSNNNIVDISPLGELAKLQYLNVEYNQVEKLDGVESLLALSNLYASHNKITSIEPVASLGKLSSLYLNHNQISDIGPLKNQAGLMSLGLAHNRVEDVSSLPPGSGAYATYLQGNQIADLAPLVKLAQEDQDGSNRFAIFWRLYLAGNPLDNPTAQEQLDQLEQLGVRLDMEYDR